MLTAVDLDQLAHTGASRSGLLDLGWPQLTRNPQPGVDLQASDGLPRDLDAMTHLELLGGQRRSEIGV